VFGTGPPRGPIGHRFTGVAGFVGQEPVAELGVIAVGVEQRVGAVGPLELRDSDGWASQRCRAGERS
jgi:hypothetical protein